MSKEPVTAAASAPSPAHVALRQAVRERPTDGAAHLALAQAYFDAGEDAAGKALLFRALALAPEDPAVQKTLGEVTARIAAIPIEEAYAARDRLAAPDLAAPVAAQPAPAAAPPAVAARPAPAAAATPAAGGPPPGRYECYFLAGRSLRPRLLLAHTLAANGTYRDYKGASGTYAYDPDTKLLSYSGATLDGKKSRYIRAGNLPTIAFQTGGGDTGECERVN